MMRFQGRKITSMGVMVSVGILLSYIESLFILPVKIPGVRIGLSNIVSVLALYLFGPMEAFMVVVARVLLAGLLFGNGMSLVFSISGAILSVFAMSILYRLNKLSCIGISVVSGVVHNIAQLIVAVLVIDNGYMIYYMPVLIIAGVFAGLIVGIISGVLIDRLKRFV